MSSTNVVHQGMGCILHEKGVAFRVWAPNAEAVSVIGSFNEFKPGANPMSSEGNGYWYVDVAKAKVKDEYKFHIKNGAMELSRIDPYAREVTSSVGNAVVYNVNDFDWGIDEFHLPTMNELVIYELHVGTFSDDDEDGSGDFSSAAKRLTHLKKIGVNCIEIMPVAEFPGNRSWGYNPSHIFAVEGSYGGRVGLKKFVKKCHQAGIGVILDVVYNHMGPGDLDLWQFDGYSENEKGGIYFYQDERSKTPWGDTRPDYGRPEVRNFLRDNAIMWIEDFHIDGLRYDSTIYMRKVDGAAIDLPDAWRLFQQINGEIRQRFPSALLIAEDLQDESGLTTPVEAGGAGFHAQWCAQFVHPIREAVSAPADEQRSMAAVAAAITQEFNADVFQRIIYSESHDEVANGHQRVTSEVQPDDPQAWFARKRSTLAAGLVFTSPGLPMIFQGQEFLESGWFQDTVPVDWDLSEEFSGIVNMYRDLIALRLNRKGKTRGLVGQGVNVYRVDEPADVIAFQRFDQHGRQDDVVVVANFSANHYDNFRVGFPCPGIWHMRLNSDWRRYDKTFKTQALDKVQADNMEWDNLGASAELTLPPYSILILSQDADS
jgi:1,4-alpha-glucan branching enzyme